MKKRALFIIVFVTLFLFINVKADEYSELYQRITTDGSMHIKSFQPTTRGQLSSIVANEANKRVNSIENYVDVYGLYDDGEDEPTASVVRNEDGTYTVGVGMAYKYLDEDSGEYQWDTEQHRLTIHIEDDEIDSEIKAKIDEIASKLEGGHFFIEDMGYINLINAIRSQSEGWTALQDYASKALIYSSDIVNIVGNNNISYTIENLCGDGDSYYIYTCGSIMLYYNEIGYSSATNIDLTLKHLLYVPTSTEETPEAYAKAALNRIKSYLGRDDITLEPYRPLSEIVDNPNYEYSEDYPPEREYIWGEFVFERVYHGYDNKLDMIYKLVIDGQEYYVMIEKNDEKLNDRYFKVDDLESDITIESTSGEIPLDTIVSIDDIVEGSDEYNKINGIIGGKFYAINFGLYSSVRLGFITKTNNGKFIIYIPIPSFLEGKTITTYYINNEGKLEEHKTKVENGFAIFETDHFSTYTLAEVPEETIPDTIEDKEEPKEEKDDQKEDDIPGNDDTKEEKKEDVEEKNVNPNTGDNTIIHFILLIISIFNLMCIYLYLLTNKGKMI